jgi:hypothetical protein
VPSIPLTHNPWLPHPIFSLLYPFGAGDGRMCEDCKLFQPISVDRGIEDGFTKKLEEFSKELEEVLPLILDAFEYWFYKNFDVFLKARSPYFKLLLKIYRQQTDLSLLLREKFGKHAK